ncbi:baseplate protein [Actinokineospora bangkokensis]|uniref:Baseplate protein n=1 Tax=Actinokineospora bangkokensis TaxID=1193682 RepID=A0A1Q9LLK3_9PSEU|nr:GPW/gp25 family protein [Actinokineospora bangkokensis]OLR92879.1 baseplate protein [Actinokineospora bangkokensis]
MDADFVGAGWAYPVGVSPVGGIALAGGTDKLEQAMRLILATYPGERPMRPAFGSRLRDHVFGPVSGATLEAVSDEVRRALAMWEPRVVVESVHSRPSPEDPAVLHIDIAYTVRATNEPRNLVFPFYSIPDTRAELPAAAGSEVG